MKRILSIALMGIIAMGLASCGKDEVKAFYTVTFDADGGTPVPEAQRVEEGKTAVAPSTAPVKAGFVFVAWSADGTNAYNFQSPVTRDLTLRARWQAEAEAEYWQVAWELNGGAWPAEGDNHATQVLKGGTLDEPAAPVKSGCTFEGWYKEAVLTNKVTFPYDVSGVTANFTLYAKWKNENPQNPTMEAGVYVAGTDYVQPYGQVATVWKDGQVFKLFIENRVNHARSVFVGERNIYTVGSRKGEYYSAMVYDNDESKTYPLYSDAYSVFVSGQDVYVAGYDVEYGPCLWKNHKGSKLPGKMNYEGKATAVFVSGNDVYVAGYLYGYKGGKDIAVLWKNNELIELSDGTVNARAYSVFVSGNDVYVAGEEKSGSSKAMLWKNNTLVPLQDDGFDHHIAKSVFVAGNDVYVAGEARKGGNDFYAVLWKNNVMTKLGYKAKATSVTVSDNDVYVAGYETDTQETQTRAAIWKNGTKSLLGNGNSTSVARYVFVKK